MSTKIGFEEVLQPTDFGFIVCSKTGVLKGLWIPDGMEKEQVPDSIVKLCREFFGIDPNENDDATILH